MPSLPPVSSSAGSAVSCAASQALRHMHAVVLLDVVVGQVAPVLQLFACQEEALLALREASPRADHLLQFECCVVAQYAHRNGLPVRRPDADLPPVAAVFLAVQLRPVRQLPAPTPSQARASHLERTPMGPSAQSATQPAKRAVREAF